MQSGTLRRVWIDKQVWTLCLVSGFLTKYVMSQCSGTPEVIQLKPFTPIFISFPDIGGYAQNMNCSWLMKRSNNSNQLIYEPLYLQLGGDASLDHVIFFNGSDDRGKIDFSSIDQPKLNTSRRAKLVSDDLYVKFVTDDNPDNNGIGFQVSVMEVEDASGSVCSNNVNLTAEVTENYLTSPGFPSVYNTSQDCSWTIMANDISDIILTLYFIDIEVDANTNICYDTLQFTGTDVICLESTFYINGNNFTFNDTVTITFSADYYDAKNFGFVLTYKKVTNSTIQSIETTFTSNKISSSSQSDTTTHSTIQSIDTTLLSNKFSSSSPYDTTTHSTIHSIETTLPSNKVSSLSTSNTTTHSTTDASGITASTDLVETPTSTNKQTSTMQTSQQTDGLLIFSVTSPEEKTTEKTEKSSQKNKQTTTEQTILQTDRQTSIYVASPEERTTERKETTSVAASLKTDSQTSMDGTSDEKTEVITTIAKILTSEDITTTIANNNTDKTISPAALGGIISVAVIGVASVGILFGVIMAMIVKYRLERTFKRTSPKKRKRRKRAESESETPEWIKMFSSTNTTNASNSNIEHGYT